MELTIKQVLPGVLRKFKDVNLELLGQVEAAKILGFQNQGDFTIALLELPNHALIAGVAKKHPTDAPNRLRGKATALARAVTEALKVTPT